MNKAIFMDRDGVINKFVPPDNKDYGRDWYILEWEQFEFLPGVMEAFSLLQACKEENPYKIFIISNQSCVAKGYIDERSLVDDILANMEHEIFKESGLHLDSWYYCPHNPEDRCSCRKPKPGMLYRLAVAYEVTLEDSWMIGDQLTDMQAGANAGVKGLVFIDPFKPMKGVQTQCRNLNYDRWMIHQPSLLEAVKFILEYDSLSSPAYT